MRIWKKTFVKSQKSDLKQNSRSFDRLVHIVYERLLLFTRNRISGVLVVEHLIGRQDVAFDGWINKYMSGVFWVASKPIGFIKSSAKHPERFWETLKSLEQFCPAICAKVYI